MTADPARAPAHVATTASTAGTTDRIVVRPWPAGVPALPPPPRPAASERWSVSWADPSGVSARARRSEGRTRGQDPSTAHTSSGTAPADRSTEIAPADQPGVTGALGIGAAGWTRDGDTWRHEEPAVTATVSAHVQHDADGRALLPALRTPAPGDLGAPNVTELPDELADGLLVVRRQVVDGALVLRADLARRAWDVEVVVSAVLPDPAVADDAVTALVRLLAAIGPVHDRLAR